MRVWASSAHRKPVAETTYGSHGAAPKRESHSHTISQKTRKDTCVRNRTLDVQVHAIFEETGPLQEQLGQ